jgi:hypothetical protein
MLLHSSRQEIYSKSKQPSDSKFYVLMKYILAPRLKITTLVFSS